MVVQRNTYIKSPEEIAIMRQAGRINAMALAAVKAMIRPGVTTADLDAAAAEVIRKHGARPAFLGVPGAYSYPATRHTQPIAGLTATLGSPNGRDIPINDDRPYILGSGLISKTNPMESLIEDLYMPLVKVMGALAFIFLSIPFVVRRPGGGEKVRIDPRLILILGPTGVGFMCIEMAGIYRYQLYLHHPTLAMIVVLSSMILGAGLGSLHSGTVPEGRKESLIAPYSAGVVLGSIALLLVVPLWGHPFLLALPMTALLLLVFAAFTGLGFLLGHIVPLSIDAYSYKQSNLLAWCWAITVTGSVIGTVIASILASDYGMFLVAALGILFYFFVAAVNLSRKKDRLVGIRSGRKESSVNAALGTAFSIPISCTLRHGTGDDVAGRPMVGGQLQQRGFLGAADGLRIRATGPEVAAGGR